MTKHTKLVHCGGYLAELDVELIETEGESWAPYLSIDDALRLDRVRELLRVGDVEAAGRLARIFELKPISRPTSSTG